MGLQIISAEKDYSNLIPAQLLKLRQLEDLRDEYLSPKGMKFNGLMTYEVVQQLVHLVQLRTTLVNFLEKKEELHTISRACEDCYFCNNSDSDPVAKSKECLYGHTDLYVWEDVQVFFTKSGAEDFIALNRKDLHQPRIRTKTIHDRNKDLRRVLEAVGMTKTI